MLIPVRHPRAIGSSLDPEISPAPDLISPGLMLMYAARMAHARLIDESHRAIVG